MARQPLRIETTPMPGWLPAMTNTNVTMKEQNKMNLRLFLMLMVLSLSACGGRIVRDESPASDLDALMTTVEPDLKPKLLKNGKEYCLELAKTREARDKCASELEAKFWSGNRDKERAWKTLVAGFDRLRLARNPCGAFAKFFRVDRCRVEWGDEGK